MAIFDAVICVAHAIQFRGSCRTFAWYMPSHVDVLIHRNPLYPQIYDTSGIKLTHVCYLMKVEWNEGNML